MYKANDTRLDCDLVVKLVRNERLTGERGIENLNRFKRGVKVVARLAQQNIVKLLDCGEYGCISFVGMD